VRIIGERSGAALLACALAAANVAHREEVVA